LHHLLTCITRTGHLTFFILLMFCMVGKGKKQLDHMRW